MFLKVAINSSIEPQGSAVMTLMAISVAILSCWELSRSANKLETASQVPYQVLI